MNTISDALNDARRRRGKHSAEFKARVVDACKPTGISMAAVAMAHRVDANLARRWIMAAQTVGEPSLKHRRDRVRRLDALSAGELAAITMQMLIHLGEQRKRSSPDSRLGSSVPIPNA